MTALNEFVDSINSHFGYEEKEHFPDLECVYPMAGAGPIPVMLAEHQQMRELFNEMRLALIDRDNELLSDLTQTLLFFMQQHNTKEENILYPLADQKLAPLIRQTG